MQYNCHLIEILYIKFICKRVVLLCFVQGQNKAQVCKVSEAFSLCKQLQSIKY